MMMRNLNDFWIIKNLEKVLIDGLRHDTSITIRVTGPDTLMAEVSFTAICNTSQALAALLVQIQIFKTLLKDEEIEIRASLLEKEYDVRLSHPKVIISIEQ